MKVRYFKGVNNRTGAVWGATPKGSIVVQVGYNTADKRTGNYFPNDLGFFVCNNFVEVEETPEYVSIMFKARLEGRI